MKILCVIDSLGSGGAQRQLVELAKGFKERGHEVSFLTYHPQDFYKGELLNINIKVSCIEEPNYLKRIWKMRIFIRRGRYDTVLSFLEGSNFICELAGLPFRKWKLVVGERSANPTIRQSSKSRVLRWFHFFSDYIVANSYENIRLIKEINILTPNRKYKVIYNMVDLDRCKSDKQYVPLRNNKLNILVAASHQYLKNAKGLVEAIKQLSAENRERLKVDWFGDERSDNSLKEAKLLVKKYSLQDIVSFHAATKMIWDYMHASDIVGLFSYYEGLPNVICEAMVLGKPVISSKVSDIPRILNKDDSLLFNPHNPTDIARSISFVMSLPFEKVISLGENNRKLARELFNKNKIISEYISLFN